jgi:hypothetical protein
VYLRALAAAVAIVVVPIAVQGAEGPRQTSNPKAKRTCTVDLQIGSRLGGVRRCRSADEREAAKQEARTVVDRIQSMKVTMCPPSC